MRMVLLTALGVGGATVFGAAIGYLFGKPSRKQNDTILSFAAGVMLAAAVLGLILPSLDYGNIVTTVAGIFVGALALNLIDKAVPHLHRMVGTDIEDHESNGKLSKVLLFVTAIAIHNLPEGIAAGVGFGSGDTSQALLIAGGIALQNIPDGAVAAVPLLALGCSRRKAFGWGVLSGAVEPLAAAAVIALSPAQSCWMPLLPGFAAGAMLFVILRELAPKIADSGWGTVCFAVGFLLLL